MDYSQFPNRSILCVDMKSFYSSCSAVMLGLNPLTCYLAVVGNNDRQGSVVLAASPALKRDFNINTGSRLFEIPSDPRIHLEPDPLPPPEIVPCKIKSETSHRDTFCINLQKFLPTISSPKRKVQYTLFCLHHNAFHHKKGYRRVTVFSLRLLPFCN